MTTSRYNWPLPTPFDPNNPFHQGWAIVSYTGGLLFPPNPNFNPYDEVHRLTLFNRLAGELDSSLCYILPSSSLVGNVQAAGHNAAVLIRLPVVGGTPAPPQPPGGWTNRGPEVVVDPTPRPGTVVSVHTPGFRGVVKQLLRGQAVLEDGGARELPFDPAFLARLEATRARFGQGGNDTIVGRFVLREANQLLQTDIEAIMDIIGDATTHGGVTKEGFLAQLFRTSAGMKWNSSVASKGVPSPISKPRTNHGYWSSMCKEYNLELCSIRARHRLNTWYHCGPPIAVGGQGVPVYSAVPNELLFVPKMP